MIVEVGTIVVADTVTVEVAVEVVAVCAPTPKDSMEMKTQMFDSSKNCLT